MWILDAEQNFFYFFLFFLSRFLACTVEGETVQIEFCGADGLQRLRLPACHRALLLLHLPFVYFKVRGGKNEQSGWWEKATFSAL